MLSYAGVSITALSLFCLGVFLAARPRKAPLARSFCFFVVLLGFWVVANFTGANLKDYHFAYLFSYADFLLAPVVALSFWRFSKTVYAQVGRRVGKVYDFGSVTLTLLLMLAVLTGNVIGVGETGIVYEPLFLLYSVGFFLLSALGIGGMVVARRVAGRQLRVQLSVMLSGLKITITALFIANLLLPQLTDSTTLNLLAGNIAYLGVLYFAATATYAIVKHRLFNVKLIVARSLAYTFLVGTLLVIYATIIVLFSIFFSPQHDVRLLDQLLYIASAIAAALAFNPLKKLFDKITNQYFYQDAYDPASLLDEYNKMLVSNVDVDKLLSASSEIISKHIKLQYCASYIKTYTNNHDALNQYGDNIKNPRVESKIVDAVQRMDSEVIDVNELTAEQDAFAKLMLDNKISLILKIEINTIKHVRVNGYMILGEKKSGIALSRQDIGIIVSLRNELIIALQNALRFEEIERFNETLQRQVEDATRKLKASNLKLKKLNDTKDDFISMTSHQLRTPLTTIKGYVSLVMDEDAGPVNDAQRKLLTQAFGSAQRLVYMVADLLNVSRLKTGKFVIERTPTDLSTIIDDELGQLKAEASLRNLKLEYKMPKKFPVLPLDETKTRQVIMNFLDNAIYYTPSGGKIRAELVEKDDSVEFLVIDNGIGVPKEERHHLFSKFYRAKNAQRARPDGTGLGLYMAQKVVVAQGGYIIFNSEEGKGSTFGFHFPKDMPEGQVTLPAQAPSGGLDG